MAATNALVVWQYSVKDDAEEAGVSEPIAIQIHAWLRDVCRYRLCTKIRVLFFPLNPVNEVLKQCLICCFLV